MGFQSVVANVIIVFLSLESILIVAIYVYRHGFWLNLLWVIAFDKYRSIDDAVANNEVPLKAQDLPILVKQVAVLCVWWIRRIVFSFHTYFRFIFYSEIEMSYETCIFYRQENNTM